MNSSRSHTHVPTYPVVDPDPSIGRQFKNLNRWDCLAICGYTSVGFAVGWFGVSTRVLRFPNSKFTAFLGLMAGVTHGLVGSMQRFMGLEPNEYEVARYGVMSEKGMEEYFRKYSITNIDMIETRKED